MRFSSLSMKGTTHLRCYSIVIAALLTHPNYQSNKRLIEKAKTYILGHQAKWAYTFHLPKGEAKKVLSSCLPKIIRGQQSTGMWKRKNAEVFTYGILRALKKADFLDQDIFRHDLLQGFREKEDLISTLVRKNIAEDKKVNVGKTVAELLSSQQKNGSWFNSISATCFQLQGLIELGMDSENKSVSQGIEWLFEQFYENFEGKGWNWKFNFENIFMADNYSDEENGFKHAAPEHSKMPCIGCFHSGAESFIKGNPATTTAIALYTLTKLGYGNDRRVLDAYESLYNIRGFQEKGGKIDDLVWCVGVYRPKSVHYDVDRTGINFDDFLKIVKERKAMK